jgi:glycosyltransferase involved in cell wall biosynthesis
VQAAMNGVPVVSWRVDPDRLLSHDTIGLCAGGSFERLLELVEELCASQEKREMLGRRAQQYAYAHHDVNQSAAALKAHIASRIGQALNRA